MDRRIISPSDDPLMTSRLDPYKVTWRNGHRTLFFNTWSNYVTISFCLLLTLETTTRLFYHFYSGLSDGLSVSLRSPSYLIVPSTDTPLQPPADSEFVCRYNPMHPKSTNKWSVILIALRSTWPYLKCQIIIILDFLSSYMSSYYTNHASKSSQIQQKLKNPWKIS